MAAEPPSVEPVEAVVFDLDGTLIDSVPDLHAAMNRLMAELGRRPITIAEARSFMGDGPMNFTTQTLRSTGGMAGGEAGEAERDALAARFLALYEADVAALTRPFPGVTETLAALRARGLKLGVCTNKPQRATDGVLAALGLDIQLDVAVGADAVPRRKPHPDHARAVLDRLGVPARRAIMVGDNEHDAEAGVGAGMDFIRMTWGYLRVAPESLPPHIALDRIEDLVAVIDKRGGGAPPT